MQVLDRAASTPYTDLLATLEELVEDTEPVVADRNAAARARFQAMGAVIDAAQSLPVQAVDRPLAKRPRAPSRRGRRTG
jgi:hypothetical protein